MQIIVFILIAFVAILLNILTAQGFFNVTDRFFWKQTTNLFSKQQPAKLSVPTGHIEANIERVGIDKEGNMQAPSSPSIVSWYQFGALPGEKGNAVFSGHRDSAWGPGVFYTLNQVKPGDEITLTDGQGKKYVYLTFQAEEFQSEDLPVKDIFADQKERKLIYLITCAGNWNIFQKRYDRRMLVAGIAP
jgi:LPXTG-site transpeptidase (sortase) family protein